MVITVLHVKDDLEKLIPINKKIAVVVSGTWDSRSLVYGKVYMYRKRTRVQPIHSP